MTTAEEILEKYIDAIGGKPAMEKINTKVTETTTTIPGKKTEIKTTTYAKRPNKAYTISEMKVLGKTVKSEGGTDGDVIWQIIPGALGSKKRILKGKEKDNRAADMAFDTAAVDWQDYYKALEIVGEEEIEGKPCYKVAFKSKDQDGVDTFCFFDKENFLITKIVKDTYIQEKPAIAEISLLDYQASDGVLVPHTLKRSSEGAEDLVIKINSIQSNVDIPESQFELPEKIKEMAAK